MPNIVTVLGKADFLLLLTSGNSYTWWLGLVLVVLGDLKCWLV